MWIEESVRKAISKAVSTLLMQDFKTLGDFQNRAAEETAKWHNKLQGPPTGTSSCVRNAG